MWPTLADVKKTAPGAAAWSSSGRKRGLAAARRAAHVGAARPDPRPDPHGRPWQRLSGRALAFRWMGGGPASISRRVPAPIRPGPSSGFCALETHFRGRPVALIWDGLGAHTSRAMPPYWLASAAGCTSNGAGYAQS